MNRPIKFEYQERQGYTLVALDASLKDFLVPEIENGRPVMTIPKKTVKDCRKIDGCVYMHLGHVSDRTMIDLIEKFQKLKQEKGWKLNEGVIIPDSEIILN